MTAEADLWAAVLKRAIDDACEAELVRDPAKTTSAAPTVRDVHEAWQFLTDTKGEWGQSREFLSTLNGLNPGIVREAALQRGLSRAARVALMEREQPKVHKPRGGRKPSAANAERNASIAADYCAGMPLGEMAEKYGVAKSTIESVVQDAGARRPPKDVAAREKIHAAVLVDWAAGVPVEEISTRYSMPIGRVRKIAMAAKVKRPAWFLSASASKASDRLRARNAERNAEIMERHARGEGYITIARAMGLKWTTVRHVVQSAASAVEAGGSVSRAGGGGGDFKASFHAQSMEEATR